MCKCEKNKNYYSHKEQFGASDWSNSHYGVQLWNGWPYYTGNRTDFITCTYSITQILLLLNDNILTTLFPYHSYKTELSIVNTKSMVMIM